MIEDAEAPPIVECSLPITSAEGNIKLVSSNQVCMREAEKLIYKGIVGLKWDIDDIKRQLNKRFNILEENMLKTTVLQASYYTSSTDNSNWDLPLQDEDALNATELLLNDKQKFDTLVEYLYLCGGDTYHKAVYACMNKLFCNNLSMRYSGIGRKGKLAFNSLKCYKAVIKAVRRRFADVSEMKLMKSISLFLAGAKDRDGGRNRR